MSDRLSKTKTDKSPFRVMPVLAVIALSPVAAYAQDAAAGAKVFQRCAMCHSTNASGPAKMGPSLAGVVGRPAGHQAGFPYSKGMAGANFAWDAAHLDAFIANPQQSVKGTKMPFGGISNARDRQNLIAYLRSLKGAPR